MVNGCEAGAAEPFWGPQLVDRLTRWPVGKNEAKELAGWQVDTLTRDTAIQARGPEAQRLGGPEQEL